MNYLFSRLSGFSADTLQYLPKASSRKIEWLSLWTFLSVFLSCFAVAYIVQITTKVWLLSILSFLFIFFVLYLIQSLLVTSSFIEIETLPDNIHKWRPTKARVIIFAFIGILFSQPLIFLYKAVFLKPTTISSFEKLDGFKRNLVERIDFYEADKKLSISQKKNFIALINGEQNLAVVSNNAKKALLIFNDVNSLSQGNFAKNLEAIGFSVKKITAVNSDNFNFALTQYAESLSPGDVSFLFFVGRYREQQGKFYLLPSGSNSSIEDAVDLQAYISQFNKSKPIASIFVINLVDYEQSNFFLAANKLKPASDSLVLIKQGIQGKKEIDGFIRNVLQKLSSPEAIKVSFSLLAQDYKNKGHKETSLKLIDNLQQTIYLNKLKEAKVLSLPEAASVLPVKEYCSKFANAGKKYATACLDSQINVLQDGINYLESVKQIELQRIEDFKSKNQSKVINYFYGAEENKMASFFYSLIAILLISGGFLFRDLSTNSIDVYEKFNYKRNRINVLKDFRRFRINAKKIRLGFMEAFVKVSIADFPNPFRVKEREKILINKDPNASDDFFDALKIKLKSETQ